MRVKDLAAVKPGLQIRSLVDREKIGVVVFIDHSDDGFAYIFWEDNISGFYGNSCDCEVVTFTHSGNELPKYVYEAPTKSHDLIRRLLTSPSCKSYATFKI